MLNLHRLFLLHELHRLGTMSAVARARSMSPSAVSQQLAQLERETKVSLLEQAGRGVVLTDAGERLARRAQEMMALMETAQAELVAAGEVEGGVLRVASFQTPMIALAPLAVNILEELHPFGDHGTLALGLVHLRLGLDLSRILRSPCQNQWH